MLRWCIKTLLSVVLTISLFGQANPGGGVNIPNTGSGGTTYVSATSPFTVTGTGTLGDPYVISAASTGSGNVVRATSPTLVTPALGTPSALVLTNATALPIAGLAGLATGVAILLGTFTPANLATALGITPVYGGNNLGMAAYIPYVTSAGVLTSNIALQFNGTNIVSTGGLTTSKQGPSVDQSFNSGSTIKILNHVNTSGTGGVYINLGGAGNNNAYLGLEGTSGGSIITGSTAKALILGQGNAFPVQIGTNDTIRATFLSAGNIILGTNSVSDAGGSQKVQVAGGVGTNGILITGTPFTVSGCSAVSPVGGATGGTFASGATGACTPTVTMGGSGFTAGTGFACTVNNLTTANLMRQTASTTTTATFSGTTVSGDVISFACDAY